MKTIYCDWCGKLVVPDAKASDRDGDTGHVAAELHIWCCGEDNDEVGQQDYDVHKGCGKLALDALRDFMRTAKAIPRTVEREIHAGKAT